MAVVEQLYGIVQMRRRTALADVRVGTTSYYMFGLVEPVVRDAFDRRMKDIHERFTRFCVTGYDGLLPVIRDECLAGGLGRDWVVFYEDWNKLQSATLPISRLPSIDDYDNYWVPDADGFEIGIKTLIKKAEDEATIASLPEDYGAPLPPVERGPESEAKSSERPRRPPRPPGAPTTTTTVIVLVVAAVAALGGFLLLRKGT